MSTASWKESSNAVNRLPTSRTPRRQQAPPRGNFAAYLRAGLLLSLAALLVLFSAMRSAASDWSGDSSARRVISEQNGNVTIHDGDRVRVALDMGDVRVRTQATGSVRYLLRIEGPANSNWNAVSTPRFQLTARSSPDGALIIGRAVRERSAERFWVTLELDVPRTTPLEVSTQGGSVDIGDIDGRLICDTAGGRIRVGRAGASARLQTAGGDVSIQDVSGDLTASTGGGNILVGSVRGGAVLHSGGGHIRVARVDGEARLETGGGNIFLDRAGANLTASTGGGRIVVGEAAGELSARTGGGGIRVWRLSGPARIQTGAGSIFLAGVASPVRASTAAGGITAMFAPVAMPTPRVASRAPNAPPPPEPPRAPRGATLADFECTGGDLVVFLPKDVSLNLDAAIEGGDNFRMSVDPSFTLVLKADDVSAGRAFRAEGVMGAGGPLLRLRAVSGNILLRPVDDSEVMALPAPPAIAVPPFPPPPPGAVPLEEGIGAALAALDASVAQMQSQLDSRQSALEAYASAEELKAMKIARRAAHDRQALEARDADERRSIEAHGRPSNPANVEYNWGGDQLSQMEGLREQFTAWLSDRVIIPAAQLRPRLARQVDPIYPDKAREAGLEGAVRLRVAIARDGSIEDVKALSGDPLLAEAATDALKQWRYRPILLDGKPVPVLTVITITFHRP